MICPDCNVDHSDLVEKWPVGSRVKIHTQMTAWLTKVKIGTVGTIIEHCDDGRPLIFFERYGSHSFHQPEQFFVLTGYSLVVPGGNESFIFSYDKNDYVASIQDKELGQRIVDFLNSEVK